MQFFWCVLCLLNLRVLFGMSLVVLIDLSNERWGRSWGGSVLVVPSRQLPQERQLQIPQARGYPASHAGVEGAISFGKGGLAGFRGLRSPTSSESFHMSPFSVWCTILSQAEPLEKPKRLRNWEFILCCISTFCEIRLWAWFPEISVNRGHKGFFIVSHRIFQVSLAELELGISSPKYINLFLQVLHHS